MVKANLNEAIGVVKTEKYEKVETEKDEINLDIFLNSANITSVEILFQES